MAGELQLGGSTVATHTGSGASAVVTIDSGVKFPSGHAIQVKSDDFSASSTSNYIVATNTGNQSSNPGSLSTNQNRLAGGARVYVELLSVTINISNSSNNIVVFASAGVDNGTHTDKGAFGYVVNIPYSGNAGEAYDLSSYPWYKSINSMGNSSTYPPDWSAHITVNGSSGYVSAGSHNVKLFGYAYNEASPSASQTLRVRRAELTVMEIQA